MENIVTNDKFKVSVIVPESTAKKTWNQMTQENGNLF